VIPRPGASGSKGHPTRGSATRRQSAPTGPPSRPHWQSWHRCDPRAAPQPKTAMLLGKMSRQTFSTLCPGPERQSSTGPSVQPPPPDTPPALPKGTQQPPPGNQPAGHGHQAVQGLGGRSSCLTRAEATKAALSRTPPPLSQGGPGLHILDGSRGSLPRRSGLLGGGRCSMNCRGTGSLRNNGDSPHPGHLLLKPGHISCVSGQTLRENKGKGC
jgi:hypothetical protein